MRIRKGVVAQTADGAYDSAGGRFGNTILRLTRELRLTDSYTPPTGTISAAKNSISA